MSDRLQLSVSTLWEPPDRGASDGSFVMKGFVRSEFSLVSFDDLKVIFFAKGEMIR